MPSNRLLTRDWCTQSGAQEIAAQVRRYWAEQGYNNVQTTVEKLSLHDRDTSYVVRSNLIGGLPPGQAEIKHPGSRAFQQMPMPRKALKGIN